MKLTKIFAAVALVVAAGAASAETAIFDFSIMKWNGTLNTGGTMPIDGFSCTGHDQCSSNVDGGVFNGDLTFQEGSIEVKATGWYDKPSDGKGYLEAAVVQDHIVNGEFGAGLGVYHKLDNSDDNITDKEYLKMSFTEMVTLNSVNLRSEGHSTSWGESNPVFQFSQDGVNWTNKNLQGTLAINLTGQNFYFKYGDGDRLRSTHKDQFYLGGMTVSRQDNTPVPPTGSPIPEPETYAMMLAGLGLMGAIARRRKAKAV